MSQFQTDLAMERCPESGGELPGVRVDAWETSGVSITDVSVDTDEGARLIGKSRGRYVTLECALALRDPDARLAMTELLSEELIRMLPDDDAPALVVGLGNRMVTPDALGPRTVDRTLVTRHLISELPDTVDERLSSVCAVAPGVLGVTGIETMELARSVARAVKPRVVVAIDSLAARAFRRVGACVQLTDTGIQPGSGVGNHRTALTEETMGVKVIALGVPMVIYAATLARDAFELLGGGDDAGLDRLRDELLGGEMRSLIVTPREIDSLVDTVSGVLSGALNRAFHPGLSASELSAMV